MIELVADAILQEFKAPLKDAEFRMARAAIAVMRGSFIEFMAYEDIDLEVRMRVIARLEKELNK